MTFSADVLRLNPELAATTPYRVKAERKLTDGFDSPLERDWDVELTARGQKHMAHPFTLHLPGGVDYTPDQIGWDYDNAMTITLYEVKGSMRQKNARDSWTRFRIAAGLLPCFRWVWVMRDRSGQWVEKVFSTETR